MEVIGMGDTHTSQEYIKRGRSSIKNNYVEVERFIYIGEVPYNLRMSSGRTYIIQPNERIILPQGAHSRYLAYKKHLFKKEQ